MKNKISNIKITVQCSFMIILSFILSNIVILKMPFGGSITLASSSPIILSSLLFGAKYGLYSSLVYSLIQIFFGFHPPPVKTACAFVMTICLDYIVPYMVLGLTQLFVKDIKSSYKKAFLGTLITGIIRYISSVISGIIIWSDLFPLGISVWQYSVIYNLIYIFPDVIIASIVSGIVYKRISSLEI